MFKNGGFYVNYLLSGFRNQYRGLMRYSGEYNLLLATLAFVCFDHYLERRVMKELQRVVTLSRTLTTISDDIDRKEQQIKLLTKI